jgi:hypothetical protein
MPGASLHVQTCDKSDYYLVNMVFEDRTVPETSALGRWRRTRLREYDGVSNCESGVFPGLICGWRRYGGVPVPPHLHAGKLG